MIERIKKLKESLCVRGGWDVQYALNEITDYLIDQHKQKENFGSGKCWECGNVNVPPTETEEKEEVTTKFEFTVNEGEREGPVLINGESFYSQEELDKLLIQEFRKGKAVGEVEGYKDGYKDAYDYISMEMNRSIQGILDRDDIKQYK